MTLIVFIIAKKNLIITFCSIYASFIYLFDANFADNTKLDSVDV